MTLAVERIIGMSKEIEGLVTESTYTKFASPICRKRMAELSMDDFNECWEGTVKDVEKALSGDFSGLTEEEMEILEPLVDFFYDGIFKGQLWSEKLSKYWD